MYKKIKSKNSVRYLKDGKFISADNIPLSILEKLQSEDLVVDNRCVFCQSPGKYKRFVNLQMVDLCGEHYFTKTIGQIAQKINENKE